MSNRFDSPEKQGLQRLIIEAVEELNTQYEFDYDIHTEYLFAKVSVERSWRADWCILFNETPVLIIEYDGLFAKSPKFTGKSGHTTVKGFCNDLDKLNTATEMGISNLRYTAIHMEDPYTVKVQIHKTLLTIIFQKKFPERKISN